MANPVLTTTEKTIAVRGGKSYSLAEAKALTILQDYDKIFVNYDGSTFTYGGYIFLNVPQVVADTPGILINVTSGGILVNEKIYPILVDNATETLISSVTPSNLPLTPYFNTEEGVFRLFNPGPMTHRISSIANYPNNVKQIFSINDFGGGGLINLDVQNAIYLICDDVDFTGSTFVISETCTFMSLTNKKLFGIADAEVNSIFQGTNGSSLYLYGLDIDNQTRDLYSNTSNVAISGNFIVKNCKLKVKRPMVAYGMENIALYDNEIYVSDGSQFGNVTGVAFYSLFCERNYISTNGVISVNLFDFSSKSSGLISISNNDIYFFNNNCFLINGTSYTNADGQTNLIKDNNFYGAYQPSIALGINKQENKWFFQNNFGATDAVDTGFYWVNIQENDITTTTGGSETYTPILFDLTKKLSDTLDGFTTNEASNRITIISRSPYNKRSVLTASLQLVIQGSIVPQLMKINVIKNGNYAGSFDNYRYTFPAITGGVKDITISIPIDHISGDIFELQIASITTVVGVKITSCQITIR